MNPMQQKQNLPINAGKIEKSLLHEIITAVINDDMDNESIKLKIFMAISD